MKQYDYTDITQVKKDAEQGDAYAQYVLGAMYLEGQGIAQNDEEAVKWFQQAADQGVAAAQNNLGLMYKIGRGVTRDYQKAVEWFQQAVKQNLAEAQLNLGVMYEYGKGVDLDLVRAYRWFATSGKNWPGTGALKPAAWACNRISFRMTSLQILQAKLMKILSIR